MGKVLLQWLGHSTFLITSPEGYRVLIDPWLENNPACPVEYRNLRAVETVLVTHAHFDHIDDCIPLAVESGAQVVGIYELCTWLMSKGVENTMDMNKGGTVQVGPLKVSMVHADHSCGISDEGQILYGGEAVGYILEFTNGFRLWHMGDTAVFGDMALIADLYKPDVVCMPIGNHYVMSPLEAARSIRLTGAKRVVPMHFGTFPVLNGTPEALRALCADVEGLEILTMIPGETLSFDGPGIP